MPRSYANASRLVALLAACAVTPASAGWFFNSATAPKPQGTPFECVLDHMEGVPLEDNVWYAQSSQADGTWHDNWQKGAFCCGTKGQRLSWTSQSHMRGICVEATSKAMCEKLARRVGCVPRSYKHEPVSPMQEGTRAGRELRYEHSTKAAAKAERSPSKAEKYHKYRAKKLERLRSLHPEKYIKWRRRAEKQHPERHAKDEAARVRRSESEVQRERRAAAQEGEARVHLPVTRGLHAHYTFASFEATSPTQWDDASGNGRHGRVSKGAVITEAVASGGGIQSKVGSVIGGINDGITFPHGSIPPVFTICSVSRYHKPEKRDLVEATEAKGAKGYNEEMSWSQYFAYQGRILDAVEENWFHGHYKGKTGIAYYDKWRTHETNVVTPNTDWVIMCGQNGGSNIVSVDGEMVGFDTGGSGSKTLTINHGWGSTKSQSSDWAVAEIAIYNRALSSAEVLFMTRYFDHVFNSGEPGMVYVGGLETPPSRSAPRSAPRARAVSKPKRMEEDLPVRRGLHARYRAIDWESSRPGVWDDSSGNGRHSEPLPLTNRDLEAGEIRTVNLATEKGGRAFVAGSHRDVVRFASDSVPAQFTLCSVTRYASRYRYKRRILGAVDDGSWFHGHDRNKAGVVKYGHGHWRTNHRNKVVPNYNWLVMCGQNGQELLGDIIMDFGENVGIGRGGAGNKQLAINWEREHRSDWHVADIAIWDRVLTNSEMVQVVRFFDERLYSKDAKYNAFKFPPLPPPSASDRSPVSRQAGAPPPAPGAPPKQNMLHTSLPVKDDLYAHYTADSWAPPGFWLDISGNELHGTVSKGTVAVSSALASGDGARSKVGFVYGGIEDGIRFPRDSIPSDFTICSVTRYHAREKRDAQEATSVNDIVFSDASSSTAGGLPNEGRILDAAEGDWFHGHDGGNAGVAFYDTGWRTPQKNILADKHDWLVMCGQNHGQGIESVGLVRADGMEIQVGNGGLGEKQLTINHGAHDDQPSDWAAMEIAIWDRPLSRAEIKQVMRYFAASMEDAGHEYMGGQAANKVFDKFGKAFDTLPTPAPAPTQHHTGPVPGFVRGGSSARADGGGRRPILQLHFNTPTPPPHPQRPRHPPTPTPTVKQWIGFDDMGDAPEQNHAMQKLVDSGGGHRSPFHCPKAFRPKSRRGMFDGFKSAEARQGCCVLDKAVGATELVSAMYMCTSYQSRDSSKPCYTGAVGDILHNLRECCSFDASRPLQRWMTADPKQARVCKRVTQPALKQLQPGGHLYSAYHRCIANPKDCYKGMFEGIHLFDKLTDATKRLFQATASQDLTADAAKFVALCANAGSVRLNNGPVHITEADDGYVILQDQQLDKRVVFDAVSHSVTAWIKTTKGGPIVAKVPKDGAEWTVHGKVLAIDPKSGALWLDVGAVGQHGLAFGEVSALDVKGRVGGKSNLLDGKWHHVAYTYHNKKHLYRLYVDGLAEGEKVIHPDADPADYVVKLGYATYDFTPKEFYGTIDRAIYWVRDLDEAEVEQDAMVEFAPLCENCIARQGSTLLLHGQHIFNGKNRLEMMDPTYRKIVQFGPGRSYSITAWIKTTKGGTILAKSPAYPAAWCKGSKSFFVGSQDGVLHWDVGLSDVDGSLSHEAEDIQDHMGDEEEVIPLQTGQTSAVVQNMGHIRGKKRVLDGKWHHVAVTFAHETSSVRFFVDGWQEGGAEIAGMSPDPPNMAIKIGFTNLDYPYWHANSYFDGKLDHVTYWDHALSQDKIERESFVMPDGESCLPAMLHLTANYGEN